MRKFLVFVVSIAAVLLAPAVAQAHHVDWNKSTARCELVNNAPVVKVSVVFVGFEDYNKPVNYSIKLDGVIKDSGVFSWDGENYTHNRELASAPGQVVVEYHAWWGGRYSGGNETHWWTVACPQPVPPPVILGCDGKPVPTGQPAPTCTTTIIQPPPPPAPPVPCTCPPPPPKKKTCPHRRDIVFHTVPGSGTRLGVVKLYVNHHLVRVLNGHYRKRSVRFEDVRLRHPGKDGRVPIRIVALLRKSDGSALQFRVRDRVKPCGKTIRRDP